jgi:hypothetical protein
MKDGLVLIRTRVAFFCVKSHVLGMGQCGLHETA